MSRVPLLTIGILGLCFTAVSLAHVPRAHAERHKQHKFVGKHPLSARADDGYCYIEVPHVHGEAIPKKHRTLYREHRGYHHFVADPKPYHYEGQTHRETAASSKDVGLERIGANTGVSLVSQRLLLVAADREKVDVHGKVIDKIAKIFLDAKM